jgi:hypothetical protein
MATCFATGRQELAGRYRDSLRQAVSRYRQFHSSESWLRGSALASLVRAIHAEETRTGVPLGRIDAKGDPFFAVIAEKPVPGP